MPTINFDTVLNRPTPDIEMGPAVESDDEIDDDRPNVNRLHEHYSESIEDLESAPTSLSQVLPASPGGSVTPPRHRSPSAPAAGSTSTLHRAFAFTLGSRPETPIGHTNKRGRDPEVDSPAQRERALESHNQTSTYRGKTKVRIIESGDAEARCELLNIQLAEERRVREGFEEQLAQNLKEAVTILTGNGTLRTEVEHLTKMNELMKKSYESCQADWTKLNKRHQDCLTELNKQAFSITASQTTMADLGRLANDEAARVSVLERRLEEAKEKHEEETATVQGTMQAKLADANAQLAEARATVQSAQDKAAADVYLLEQQLEEANEKYKEATAEVAVVRGTAEAKLTDASAELAEARATARAAQDKAAVDIHPLEQKLAEANEKYEETVAELAISRDTTQAQLAKTNAELAKAQATSKTAQANAAIDIRNLEQQLAEANEKYEKAAAEVVAIQDSDSQQELMEIKARLVEVQTAMEAAKDEATRRIHLLERQLVLSNGSIKESSTKLTEALLKSQKRKEELQSLRRDAGSHSQALTQGIQEAREKLLSEHQRAIQALKADMQGKLADTETKHKEVCKKLSAKHEQAIQVLDVNKTKVQRELENTKEKHEEVCEKLSAEHGRAIHALNVANDAEMEKLADQKGKSQAEWLRDKEASLSQVFTERCNDLRRELQAKAAEDLDEALATEALRINKVGNRALKEALQRAESAERNLEAERQKATRISAMRAGNDRRPQLDASSDDDGMYTDRPKPLSGQALARPQQLMPQARTSGHQQRPGEPSSSAISNTIRPPLSFNDSSHESQPRVPNLRLSNPAVAQTANEEFRSNILDPDGEDMDIDRPNPLSERVLGKQPERPTLPWSEAATSRPRQTLGVPTNRAAGTSGHQQTLNSTANNEVILPPLLFSRPYGADQPLSDRLRIPSARLRTPVASNRLNTRLRTPAPPPRVNPAPTSSTPVIPADGLRRDAGSSSSALSNSSSLPAPIMSPSTNFTPRNLAPTPSNLGPAPVPTASSSSNYPNDNLPPNSNGSPRTSTSTSSSGAPPRTFIAPAGSTSSQPSGSGNASASSSPASLPSSNIGGFDDGQMAILGEIRHIRNHLDNQQTVRPKGSSRRPHGEFKVNSPSKVRTTERNRLIQGVRAEMNKLLHIEHDFNIVDVVDNSQARLEDVEAFLTGQRGAPHLDPLPVYWNKLSSPWNTQLAASFATHYIQMKPTADRTQILDYFAQRLETLRKCLIRSSAKEGETEDALINRHASKRLRDLKQNRTQSRKKRIYESRRRICEAGLQADRNGAWNLLYQMVGTLGINGLSSDDSDGDDHIVRVKDWRSSDVKDFLMYIDANRKVANEFGNNLPGNRPHARSRRPHARSSPYPAIAGFPLNFYDKPWYDNLTDVERVNLGALDPVDLPVWN